MQFTGRCPVCSGGVTMHLSEIHHGDKEREWTGTCVRGHRLSLMAWKPGVSVDDLIKVPGPSPSIRNTKLAKKR